MKNTLRAMFAGLFGLALIVALPACATDDTDTTTVIPEDPVDTYTPPDTLVVEDTTVILDGTTEPTMEDDPQQ